MKAFGRQRKPVCTNVTSYATIATAARRSFFLFFALSIRLDYSVPDRAGGAYNLIFHGFETTERRMAVGEI